MNDLYRAPVPARDLPPTEIEQPDPQLSLSSGRASALQITLTALACLFIISATIYGLSRPVTEPAQTAAAPAAQETTGAAPQDAQPNTGGNVRGDQNAQPKGELQQNMPAQQPQPEPQKPGQPDDSQR